MDGSNFGGAAALAAGSATSAPIASLSVGTHTINASYSGDGNFNTNLSANFTQTVNASPVTPATGGAAISADATGGAYTNLTGPVYQEPSANGSDVGIGTII